MVVIPIQLQRLCILSLTINIAFAFESIESCHRQVFYRKSQKENQQPKFSDGELEACAFRVTLGNAGCDDNIISLLEISSSSPLTKSKSEILLTKDALYGFCYKTNCNNDEFVENIYKRLMSTNPNDLSSNAHISEKDRHVMLKCTLKALSKVLKVPAIQNKNIASSGRVKRQDPDDDGFYDLPEGEGDTGFEVPSINGPLEFTEKPQNGPGAPQGGPGAPQDGPGAPQAVENNLESVEGSSQEKQQSEEENSGEETSGEESDVTDSLGLPKPHRKVTRLTTSTKKPAEDEEDHRRRKPPRYDTIDKVMSEYAVMLAFFIILGVTIFSLSSMAVILTLRSTKKFGHALD